MTKPFSLFSAILLTLGFATDARAAFGPGTNLSAMTDAFVKSMIETVALGTDFRAYQSATPLGMVIGLDMGLEVTAIKVPQEFTDAMVATGQNAASVPTLLPVPKLNLHKGLPFGIDLGFSYVKYQSYQIIGGSVKYAILAGNLAKPSVATRLSYNNSDLSYIKTRTWKLDVLVSKPIAFLFDPYAGIGYQIGGGTIDFPTGGGTGMPASVQGSQSVSAPHFFVGFPLKLALLKIVGEYDYSFSGFSTFGAKLSLGF